MHFSAEPQQRRARQGLPKKMLQMCISKSVKGNHMVTASLHHVHGYHVSTSTYIYIYIHVLYIYIHVLYIYICIYGGFLKRGPPKSSSLIRVSIINHPFWVHPFMELHIYICTYIYIYICMYIYIYIYVYVHSIPL